MILKHMVFFLLTMSKVRLILVLYATRVELQGYKRKPSQYSHVRGSLNFVTKAIRVHVQLNL